MIKILEPRTGMPPKAKDKDVNGMKKSIENSKIVGLLCPVQGFPAPTFRYHSLLKAA